MPDTIRGILLIPHDDAMLAGGPCGSRAPTAWLIGSTWWPDGPAVSVTSPGVKRALALAWVGKAITQAWGWLPHSLWYPIASNIADVIAGGCNGTFALSWIQAQVKDIGTIIAVDGDGREVWGG